jgi:hypothetical protein
LPLSKLFSSLRLRGVTVRNRLVLAPCASIRPRTGSLATITWRSWAALLQGSDCERIEGRQAHIQATRTDFGRPSSSTRLRACIAMTTSVLRRRSICERKPSPITGGSWMFPPRLVVCTRTSSSSPCVHALRCFGDADRAGSAHSLPSRLVRPLIGVERSRQHQDGAVLLCRSVRVTNSPIRATTRRVTLSPPVGRRIEPVHDQPLMKRTTRCGYYPHR